MKCVSACIGLLLATSVVFAQQKPMASPPETATVMIGGKAISIKYNSPRVKGREGHIFISDGLISHDPTYPVWRAGANPATTLHTDADMQMGDLQVPAGTYTLFVDISDPSQWALIVSKQTGEWGTVYDHTQDLGRIKMMMAKPQALVEDLKYTLTKGGGGKGTLTLAWENVSSVSWCTSWYIDPRLGQV